MSRCTCKLGGTMCAACRSQWSSFQAQRDLINRVQVLEVKAKELEDRVKCLEELLQ